MTFFLVWPLFIACRGVSPQHSQHLYWTEPGLELHPMTTYSSGVWSFFRKHRNDVLSTKMPIKTSVSTVKIMFSPCSSSLWADLISLPEEILVRWKQRFNGWWNRGKRDTGKWWNFGGCIFVRLKGFESNPSKLPSFWKESNHWNRSHILVYSSRVAT